MLITNTTIVTWERPNRILPDYGIYISGDRIQDIGLSSKLEDRYPRTRKLNARGQFVLPGGICAHTHFYRVLARGLRMPGVPARDWSELQQRLWWPYERALSQEDVRYSTLIALIDAIKHGTTTVFDRHASSSAVDGSLDVIADSVDKAGLRAILSYEVTDRDGQAITDAGIRENVRFLTRLASEPHPRLAGLFGLHASSTLSGATLQACKAAPPDGTGFHINVAEHESDEYDCLQKTRMRVVERLKNHGILGARSIAAHCVHVDALETMLLKETATWVAHQPRANMNDGVGVAPVESLAHAGVRVCLGNDGYSNAMWEEWKAASFLHKSASRDPRTVDAGCIAQMAVDNAAVLAGVCFSGAVIGQIVPDAMADLIFVDYQSPTPVTAENLPWHIIHGFESSMVTTTMVAGKVLMKDRVLLTLDEVEIAARARELSPRIWKRYEENLRE